MLWVHEIRDQFIEPALPIAWNPSETVVTRPSLNIRDPIDIDYLTFGIELAIQSALSFYLFELEVSSNVFELAI